MNLKKIPMQTTTIMVYLFCYVTFFLFSWISKINNSQRLINDEGIFTSNPRNLIGFHIMGIIWIGIIPIVLLKHSIWKVLIGNEILDRSFVFLYILIFILILTIVFKQSKYASQKTQEPFKSTVHLSSPFFISYFIVRVLFLFVYELWFRGFLLFDSIGWVGINAAVTGNVFLYVLLHIFNSKKEMLACIPFGILVCFLSILFNAAWPAIILHIGVSLVYELTIYRSYLYPSKIARL
ncbi:CPBP family intramembrane metalloprotease [Flavobacterium gawalongense]|uniref:CPBP family intramembrane metalloprotease n=2 Tax=Flavobacterium gawalongense TaxID=2594432 RepID=A0ABY3CK72_9FLAO|nr:CPBP family intramembrane metalloprotease [Flavobacterium gawalongense]TRX05344.1 CPBP family intramembrane metalloprotease [Flavobacterium gawalongense]